VKFSLLYSLQMSNSLCFTLSKYQLHVSKCACKQNALLRCETERRISVRARTAQTWPKLWLRDFMWRQKMLFCQRVYSALNCSCSSKNKPLHKTILCSVYTQVDNWMSYILVLLKFCISTVIGTSMTCMELD
jgi:hypothetical protein